MESPIKTRLKITGQKQKREEKLPHSPFKRILTSRFSWVIGGCLAAALIALPSDALQAAAAKKVGAANCPCPDPLIDFVAVGKKAIPAVVFIQTEGAPPEEYGYPYGQQNPFEDDDFFRRFFGAPRPPQKPTPQRSQGSGFFVSPDGDIMTNAHVVKGATKIIVVMHDGRKMEATLVGADSYTDIAIIKVEGKGFPFLVLGDSDAIEVGEWVAAIGSPFGLQGSMTKGIVSALGRNNLRITSFEDFLQTDAAINPGNSGGPLVTRNGEVIGINTAIASPTGANNGIGFAIPSSMVKPIMEQIINNKGVIVRGFIGVSLQPVDKDIAEAFDLPEPGTGVLITEVITGSPADKAGIKQGDVVLEYNKAPIKSMQKFRKDISMMHPGSTVQLKVNRKGEILTIPVELGSATDNITSEGAVQKLGMKLENLTPDLAKQLGYSSREDGVVITEVKPGSPAALAGLRPGFLIVRVNYQTVTNVNDFNDAIGKIDNNKPFLVLVRQGNMMRFYTVKME